MKVAASLSDHSPAVLLGLDDPLCLRTGRVSTNCRQKQAGKRAMTCPVEVGIDELLVVLDEQASSVSSQGSKGCLADTRAQVLHTMLHK